MANIPAPDGGWYPQLGSVALQSGTHAADNVLADAAGASRKPFHYHDKGIMAMIGRGAAIAEVGRTAACSCTAYRLLGVAGACTPWPSTARGPNRVDAFVNWGRDNLTQSRGPRRSTDPETAQIDWGDDVTAEPDADRAGTG